jgi:hypothetical protein
MEYGIENESSVIKMSSYRRIWKNKGDELAAD